MAHVTVWRPETPESQNPEPWAEMKARADLFAAAPDLLAALETVLERIYDNPDYADADGRAMLAQAQAAIAKARGE